MNFYAKLNNIFKENYLLLMTRATFGLFATTHEVTAIDNINHTTKTINSLLLNDCAISSSFATYSIFMSGYIFLARSSLITFFIRETSR